MSPSAYVPFIEGEFAVLFQANQKIVFIGDSIMEAGRTTAAPYGDGYVNMVRNFLLARYPQLNLNIVNEGIGGNTVRDLDQRWETDVVAQHPDWLCVGIGINDVWGQFGNAVVQGVPIAEYQATLQRLLKRAQDATGAKLILIEPFMIETDNADLMWQMTRVYAGTLDGLAMPFGATVIRTQAAFNAVLTSQPVIFWSTDRIHPDGPGHAVIALEFLRTIGFAV